ncbi:hypothetical protein GOODEAATRI_000017, partial [Goodea atripinnis]
SPKDISRKVEDDTIIFYDVQSGSSAVYQCNISNPYGYLLSNAFVNVLSEPPRVLTPANKLYQVIENHPVLMDCSSFGSPIPKIKCTLDGDSYILHDNGTLEIQVAQAQHKGKYICVASNMLGKYENHVYLETRGRPDAPTDLELTDQKKRSVQLTWIPGEEHYSPIQGLQSNGPGLRYKVSWRRKRPGSDWTTVTVANNSKFIVSGTPTFSPYEIKVQAVNDHGEGPEPAVALGYSGEDCESNSTF